MMSTNSISRHESEEEEKEIPSSSSSADIINDIYAQEEDEKSSSSSVTQISSSIQLVSKSVSERLLSKFYDVSEFGFDYSQSVCGLLRFRGACSSPPPAGFSPNATWPPSSEPPSNPTPEEDPLDFLLMPACVLRGDAEVFIIANGWPTADF